MPDLTTLSAADLGRGIAAREIDPVALTEAYLAKIDAHPLRDGIYATVTHDRARAEAAAAKERAENGVRRSALDGVPVSWKDLVDSAGTATEAGSALLKGRVPNADGEVLRIATGMGLVCLGKTHLSELAFSGLGLNPVTATPPCVNDAEAVAGGSSSGAAASVAYGLAAAAVGSDTGGSVRIPAAWNDLVGLKTTHGALSLRGVVPLAAKFDTIGPLCRTVEDASLMFEALGGGAAPDLTEASLQGRRFARLDTIVLDDLAEPQAQAYASALERLSAAGAEIVPFDFPALNARMDDAGVLYTSEAWATWRHEIEPNGDKMFPPIRERFAAGAGHLAADYVAAWQALDRTRGDWAVATAGFDAVLCPTAPTMPPKIAKMMEQGPDYVTANLMCLRNTRVGNLMGLCGVTLPTGTPSCGIQLMGAMGGDKAILRLAAAAEKALG